MDPPHKVYYDIRKISLGNRHNYCHMHSDCMFQFSICFENYLMHYCSKYLRKYLCGDYQTSAQ